MTARPEPTALPGPRPQWRAWLPLAVALAWVALARVPLVLNARAHLDSDLAVDGLTLIDALNGHWRWHYPATPFIGSPPVLLSYIQAKAWGPTPAALVSGGVVAYGLVVGAVYWLNRRAFGPAVAIWGLVPLAFASTGTIWLSGRVTGGHLLVTAWHAGAFALLWDALAKPGWWRSVALGLWSGFGLYIDSMFAVTWVGMGVALLVRFLASSPRSPGKGSGVRGVAGPMGCLIAFALASGLGLAPRIIGARVDPHDAYVGQFEPIIHTDHLASNARILALDCLPRLVAGHRLPGLQAEPDPSLDHPKESPWLGLATTVVSLGLFGWAIVSLSIGGSAPNSTRLAIRLGLLASSLAVLAGFLIYPSISNSDHYRYLVFLLVPWSSGFGLAINRLAARWPGGRWAAGTLAFGFAFLMTVDAGRWYARLGWVDSTGLPIRLAVEAPVVDWLDDHLKHSTILGDYWDVYRVSYLTQGRVKALPFPQYPDRFPEIRRNLPSARNPVLIVRPGPFGPIYRSRALAAGGHELGRFRGLSIVEWPGDLTP